MSKTEETTNQKKLWSEIEDDPKKRSYEIRFEEEEKERTRKVKDELGNDKIITEKVKVIKKIFPIRRAVKERRNMKKFGEVEKVPKRENLFGDVVIASVPFETIDSGEKEEINIITQLKNITKESILEKRLKEEIDMLDKTDFTKEDQSKTFDKTRAENNKDNKPKIQTDYIYSVKISNIVFLQTDDEDKKILDINEKLRQQERDFKLFVEEEVLKKYISSNYKDVWRIKIPKNKAKTRFVGICFVSFKMEEYAAKSIDEINKIKYNSCALKAEMSINK